MRHKVAQWGDISEHYQRGAIVVGNGASIAVSPNFSYGSLLDHAKKNGLLTEDVQILFNFFDTQDFELVLRLVWQANNVNKSLEIPDDRTHEAYRHVRDCLIEAVRAVHPEHETVKAHLPLMCRFLESFGTVLSLNYDLLIYWAMTHGLNGDGRHRFKDCFLWNRRFDDDWSKYRELYKERTNTLVFYPHGSLALCRDVVEQEFKIHAAGARLLEAILAEWQSERAVPLFVSEGTRTQKICSIQSSYYLSTVYREVLTSVAGTLTIFGWGIGEHDRHLLQRMRNAGIKRVAVSVFRNDQVYCNYAYQIIRNDLGEVHVDFFDSESPGCWIHPIRTQD
ncbi:DUF4917 family protein [Stenotrophomonas sp. 59]|uniref:DUF4917 family protein n=1 Tax=Stenotrophomonas sp. 59 TaxID=3051120 RepID=UPI00256F4D88|nr:DUF4917 family protein [Stenotrophomonas sp. 59]